MQVLERLVADDPDDVIDGGLFDRLARFGLIELDSDPRRPLFRRGVSVSDRVLDLARGTLAIDRELSGAVTLTTASLERAAESGRAVELTGVTAALVAAARGESGALVVASGNVGNGRAAAVRRAIAAAGGSAICVRAAALAGEATAMRRQCRAIVRECRLHAATLVVEDIDTLGDRASLLTSEVLDVLDGVVFATAREGAAVATTRPVVEVRVKLPGVEERVGLWADALGDSVIEGTAEVCARRYAIAPDMLARAATAAKTHAGGEAITPEHVHEAMRAQLAKKLSGLATRIETKQTWDDLVMPTDQFDLLIELCTRSLYRHQVLETWGFGDKIGRGHGIAALFSGPPGTGKTMVAGLLAQELGLDLYQVDLAKIVSKYIGETEKMLAELFDAAEAGHAILLFDEADSLFGKRTAVTSSNDRYANLEVNYLLQRLETFTGIAILTTNHENAIDEAFKRRLAMHVRVPTPDASERMALWQAMLPARADVAPDLDFAPLATQFVMSGGYIKNAVVRAAYFAAHDNAPIGAAHLWRAARAEYEAMGKLAFLAAA